MGGWSLLYDECKRAPYSIVKMWLDGAMKALRWSLGSTASWLVRVAGATLETKSEVTPLVVIHGGPGLPHQYLRSLAALARPDRPIVFYDQLGCGLSHPDHSRQPPSWNLSVFVKELDVVIEAVAPRGRCDVLGHSSGGWIAIEALLGDQSIRSRIQKLVLASTPLDMPAFLDEQRRLIRSMRWSINRRLSRSPPSDPSGATGYQRAYQQFLRQHICRAPWPAELVDAMRQSSQKVYNALWGHSEVWVTGLLRSWSRLADASKLDLPILLTSGRYDEVTPKLVTAANDVLPRSQWRLFENSAHMAHLEEPQAYLDVVDAFLREERA